MKASERKTCFVFLVLLVGVFLAGSFAIPDPAGAESCVYLGGPNKSGTGEKKSETETSQPGKPKDGSKQRRQSRNQAPERTSHKVTGYRGLPWGGSPDQVKEKFGNPSWGAFNSWQNAWQKWTEKWDYELPEEIDALLGWGNYKPGKITTPANLWAGFKTVNGRKRLVWIYVYWTQLSDNDFDFIGRKTKKNLEVTLGSPSIKNEENTGDNPLYFPHDYRKADESRVWTGKFGVVRWGKESSHDWVGLTYQSRKLQSPGAKFPPEGRNLNKSTSKNRKNKINSNSTKETRIDGFRGLPWGASADQCQRKLGQPHSKSARSMAEQINVNIPDGGSSVWVYKEKKHGENATTWLGFGDGSEGQEGLVWGVTSWDNPDAGDKIKNKLKTKLQENYGATLSRNTWLDNHGKAVLYKHGGSEVGVQYISSALAQD